MAYALHPKQKEVAKSQARFKVLNCGRRWGKTTLAVEIMLMKAFAKPVRIAYIAPTIQQARDIAFAMLKKELQPILLKVKEAPSLEFTVKTQDGGESLILLRGWEAIENLRGQAFDFLILDEVASMRNFWIGWQEVLRPTLTDTKGGAMFVSTPKGFNHFYDLFNQELKDKDYKSFNFSSYDNPFVPKEEIDNAKATLPIERFEQEYMASFQKTQGLVYKEFDRQKHLYETLPENTYEKLGGVDFGFRNPAGVLNIYLAKDKFWVEEEWKKTERTDAVIADYVKGYNFNEVYPDPENAGGIEELKQRGVNVREVTKGKGSITAGISKVKEAFITGRLMINKRCVNLIAELEMYSYDDEKGDRNENENPIKANDHLLDALRYVIMMKDVGMDMEAEKSERLLSRLRNLQPQTR